MQNHGMLPDRWNVKQKYMAVNMEKNKCVANCFHDIKNVAIHNIYLSVVLHYCHFLIAVIKV